MHFLNPGILWGLLALAVPIIIHFFNLQRPREILFSNVAFVREVKKSVVRRLRFQKWLLLLTRMLAVTALVFAFANPFLNRENNNPLLQGRRSVAIVIDDSYSMTAGNERGGYFQQAQAMARNIVKAYGKQDEFLITTTGGLQLNAGFGDQAEALDDVKEVSIAQSIHAHNEILHFRKEIFSAASHSSSELYFISDFQLSTVMADSQSVKIDSGFSFKYLPLASRPQPNVYVAGHKILSRIIEKDKPVKMQMSLRNDGPAEAKDLGVRVLIEGKVAAIANKSIDAEGTVDLELSFTPTKSGWLSGYIELEDHPIEFDNKRYFSLYVPASEKVLIAEGQVSPHLKVLFQQTDPFKQFDSKFISARNLSGASLTDYRSVVLLGVPDFSSGLVEKIQSFVENGGSLLFFPAKGMKIDKVNILLKKLGAGNFEAAEKIQGGMKADQVELEHPIFKGVFSSERRNRNFDAPNVYQYFPFKPTSGAVQNRVMSLANQEPFLLESKIGNGLLFTFTSFPDDSWTDFHLKTSFAPVIFRILQIMNQTQNVQSGQRIGEYQPKILQTANQEIIRLVGEEDLEFTPEQYVQGGATVLNFEKLEIPEGNYAIMQGDSLLERIAFNISDQESQLAFSSASKLPELLRQKGYGSGIQVVTARPDQLAASIRSEREGTPLWKYFVLGALAFLVIEILMLKFGRKA